MSRKVTLPAGVGESPNTYDPTDVGRSHGMMGQRFEAWHTCSHSAVRGRGEKRGHAAQQPRTEVEMFKKEMKIGIM